MKILHTSDWHLGRSLYGKKRDAEFAAFLNWMVQTLNDQEVDILLIAGDVFDTTTPSHRAQELYYHFLGKVAATTCRHVIIIGGNHDSPSFLNAPKNLLKSLNIHVIGCRTEVVEDEVLVLNNAQHCPELIVCAVPYLRDRDIRTAEAGETIEDKGQKLADGIRDHYSAVIHHAEKTQTTLAEAIPIIAMGHLFTAGGKTLADDGVRELYVGSLAHVTAAIFPDSIDYLALGHLHVPQKIGGNDTRRYSGSPLPMGFGEAKQQKTLCLVSFDQLANHDTTASVELIDIPTFQKLERIKGDWDFISDRIETLSTTQTSLWLEIVYDGNDVISDLAESLDALIAETPIEILRIKNNRVIDRVLNKTSVNETLDDLDSTDIFERCLDAHNISNEQRVELRHSYQEVIASLNDDDYPAEKTSHP